MTDFNCECVDTNTNDTLAEYRTRIMQRCGYANNAANPPPGMAALITTFLQDAQKQMYLAYPALRTRRMFKWSLRVGERFYGIRANDENWTPEEVSLVGGAPGTVSFAGDAPEDGQRIQFWPGDDPLPPELTAYVQYYVVNSTEEYGACELALTEGGDSITFTTTVAAHASVSPSASCIFNLEPYKNVEAYLVDPNGTWFPMACGIPPYFYTTVLQPGLPLRFDIRQCIEVFPSPSADGFSLYIKGHFGLAAFTADADKPTIDGQLVYLEALANALDYYGKKAAAGIATQANDYLGQLTAGTHLSKRYVPGTQPLPPAVMPIRARDFTP